MRKIHIQNIKTSYTKEEIRKAGYCVEGEEESYDGQPVWGQYPRIEERVFELEKGTYELDILGKYENKYAKHFLVG